MRENEAQQRLKIAGLCGKVLAMLQFGRYSTKEITSLIRESLEEEPDAPD